MFSPKYKLTNDIVKLLVAIAEARSSIERAKILPKQELRLRRQALVRMTHSSTAIEGNRLGVSDIEAILARKKPNAPDRDIYEAQNYLKALRYIEQLVLRKRPLTEQILLNIHKLVTDRTLAKQDSGHYRKGPVYIVKRRFGLLEEVVYTGPDTKKVVGLCRNLINWLRQSEKAGINPVIAAGIAHQEIAAIHSFNDGNGRTARALATLILYSRGYDFRHLFALEDYYNLDRPAYYKAINIGKNYKNRQRDFTAWLEYFVKGFKEEIDAVKNKVAVLSLKKVRPDLGSKVYLDEDQLKVLDQMDQAGRLTAAAAADILGAPKRTAQLLLQKLKGLGFIKQIGKGPASAYTVK